MAARPSYRRRSQLRPALLCCFIILSLVAATSNAVHVRHMQGALIGEGSSVKVNNGAAEEFLPLANASPSSSSPTPTPTSFSVSSLAASIPSSSSSSPSIPTSSSPTEVSASSSSSSSATTAQETTTPSVEEPVFYSLQPLPSPSPSPSAPSAPLPSVAITLDHVDVAVDTEAETDVSLSSMPDSTDSHEYAWSVTDYGDCSANCDLNIRIGTQARGVSCLQFGSPSVIVDDSYCNSTMAKPPSTEICVFECPLFDCVISWGISSWSACSSECGVGAQSRTVQCISTCDNGTNADGLPKESITSMDPSYCTESGYDQPSASISCLGTSATCSDSTPVWNTGVFGACNASCGLGVMTREIWCTLGDSSVHLPLSVCLADSSLMIPSTLMECDLGACESFNYIESDFGECSVTCGEGIATRVISCVSDQAGTVALSKCANSGEQPSDHGICDEGLCESYEWVVGPLGECSASCGDGVAIRQVTCVGTMFGTIDATGKSCFTNTSNVVPLSSFTCHHIDCEVFEWTIGTWSECSTTCDAGTKTRAITCKGDQGSIDSTGLACDCVKPTSTADCVMTTCECTDCYEWAFSPWSDCSVTCGPGTEIRVIQCYNSYTGLPADSASRCNGLPVTTQTCQNTACKTYEWVVTGYGECSATCGGGYRNATLACLELPTRTYVSTALCPLATRPSTSLACNTVACETWSWTVSEWGSCSVTAGVGIKTRTVACTGSYGSTYDASYCIDSGVQPINTTACNITVITYKWVVSSWTECDATCQGGQSRTVSCVSSLGFIVEIDYCHGSVPSSYALCNSDVACPGPYWVKTDWDDCSASCGSGHQTRDVFCVSATGVTLDDSECPGTMPESSRSCSKSDCESWDWAATSWSDCSVTCGVGYQERTVTCYSNLQGVVSDKFCDAFASDRPTDYETCTGDICLIAVATPTYAWTVGQYSDCSLTCGEGIKYRVVECVEQISGVVVADALCASVFGTTQPASSSSCVLSAICPTYQWHVASWSDCSVSCETGSKSRAVWCQEVASSDVVDDTYCLLDESDTAPAEQESCIASVTSCELPTWNVGLFTTCSVTCGSGYQHRAVWCTHKGAEVAESLCLAEEQPATSSTCESAVCERYSFTLGEYGSCSVTCGSAIGVESRNVYCSSNVRTSYYVALTYCEAEGLTLPTDHVACTAAIELCEDYSWTYGDYSECSASCGYGVRTREVTCLGSRGTIDYTDLLCTETPTAYEQCFAGACPAHTTATTTTTTSVPAMAAISIPSATIATVTPIASATTTPTATVASLPPTVTSEFGLPRRTTTTPPNALLPGR